MTTNPAGETPDVGVPRHLARDMTVADQQDWLRGFLKRHTVSRRTALRGGAGAFAGLALAASPWAQGSALAAATTGGPTVVGRRLSFGDDPRTAMSMAGELTAKPAGAVVVELGTDTGYGTKLAAEVRELVSLVPQQDGSIRGADQFFVHATADKLCAGTRYHYRFRMPDGTVTADASFVTAPESGDRSPWSFTAFADQGVNAGATGFSDNYYKPDDTRRTMAPSDALIARVASDAPSFHLLAGDICYADPSGTGSAVKVGAPANAGFDTFDPTQWTTYFAAIERSAASVPWMFATGNHDMEALYDNNTANSGTHGYSGHAARLDLPKTGPSGCPSVYSFTHQNVGVVSVDANDLSYEIPTNAGYSGGAQLRWLTDTLAGLRGDPSIDFIVVFFHHCAFATSSTHASDGGVRAALAPLFDKYSVDLVVQGHNHQYERTNPIRGGKSTKDAPDGATVSPEQDGTTYLCVGSAGRPRYGWQPGENDRYRGMTNPDTGTHVNSFVVAKGGGKQPEQVDWSQARYLDYAYIRCEVTPAGPGGTSHLTVRAISDLGAEIDSVDLARKVPAGHTHGAAWRTTRSGLSVPGLVGV